MFYIIITLLLAPALLLLAGYLVLPRPLFKLVDSRIDKAMDAEKFNKTSSYGHIGFRPTHTEVKDLKLEIEGQLPNDLEGVYLRNGTNIQFATTRSRHHMFNGAGMLHQVQIKDGQAWYANTYVRTPRYQIEDKAGEEVYMQFSDLAGGGKAGMAKLVTELLKKRRGIVPALTNLDSGSSTTAIQHHHNKLYCLQETSYPFALNCQQRNGLLQLDGTGEFDTFGGKLESPFTAHPKVDPATGDFYTFSIDFQAGKIHHARLVQGQLENYTSVHQQKPSMAFLHDYFLTENHLVFPDLSLRFDPKNMMGPEQSPMVFDPDYKLRWGVLPRNCQPGDQVQWFETDQPGHIWHMINGWEQTSEEGHQELVLHAPVFRDYPSNIPIHNPEESHALLTRWRLNLATGKVSEDKQLLDHFYERPSFNLDYIGKPSRYAYMLDEEKEGIMGKGVLKYDVIDEQEVAYFDYGEYYGGEALFIPRRDSKAEDDGYLVDLLMSDERACLLVLDAATMSEMARLHIPHRVPFGVHACWLDDTKLASLYQ
jgi:carotenoid cleavage dioxygenase